MPSAGIFQTSKEELDKHPIKKVDYDGIIQHRRSTDVLFAILIWCMWAGMCYIGYTGILKGNPYRLIAPINYLGNACGNTPSTVGEKYLYTIMSNGLGVCVNTCPVERVVSLESTNPNDYYCLDSLVPSNAKLRSSYIASNCMDSDTKQYSISKECFCNIKRTTKNVLRRCRFTESSIKSQYSTLSKTPSYFQTFIADISTARNVIFGFGFCLAIVLSFFWSTFLKVRFVGTFLVWSGLVGTLVIMIALCFIAQKTAQTWSNESPSIHSKNETLSLQIFSAVLLTASVLFFCLMVFLYKQINLSIRMVALTSACINDMKFIVFVPILNLIAFGIFLVPCIIYMFYVASDGTFESVIVNGVYVGRKYVPAQGVVDRLWYLFFCFLWTMNWVGGMSAIAIAIACAKWYFTKERSSIGSMTVIRAYGTTIRYHWGTAAFGSLVIAIVQFIRWYLLYLQKVYNRVAGTRTLVKFVCCCVQCCLGCLDCCLKFISKNAYIQTAIHGSGFMTGCKDSFFLIARNVFRVGAIHVIGGLAMFTGKVFVIAATVGASFFYLDRAFSKELNGIVGVLVLIGLIAWFTTCMFMDVYQMSLETIFMCFLADEEAHGGIARFADEDTKYFISENGAIIPGTHGTVAVAGKGGKGGKDTVVDV